MKLIISLKLSLILLLFYSSSFSQSNPPLPSVDKVFDDIKKNEFVYKSLKNDYHIADPKACKFIKGLQSYDGTQSEAYWGTYKSQHADYRWPDDRAAVYFTVITPKSTEGVSYVIPLLVEYSRVKNDIITNEWTYYWWMFKAPISTSGKPKQNELRDTLINALSKIEHHFIPEEGYGYPSKMDRFIRIESIVDAPTQDVTKSDSYREWMTRYYIIKGDHIVTEEDSDNMLGYDGVKEHYKNAEFQIAVTFERDKKIDNQKATDWKFHEYVIYESKFLNKGDLVEDTNFYATLHRYGFEKIYQKEPSKVERDYFTTASIDEFEKDVQKAIEDIFLDKPNAEDNFLQFCKDEIVRDNWVIAINEMKRKMVKFEEVKLYTQDIYNYARGRDEHADISISIYYSRVLAKKQIVKSVYKSSGMSKDIYAKGGWLQKSSIGGMYELIEIGNKLKIATFPPKENSIKF